MTTSFVAENRTRAGKAYAGSTVDLLVHFKTIAGVLTDPTTVQIQVKAPNNNETTYVYGTDSEVTRSVIGKFQARITVDMPGRWFYRWLTTGSGTTVALEHWVDCQKSAFVDDAYALSDYE